MNTRNAVISSLRWGLLCCVLLLVVALPVAGDATRTAALYGGWEEVAGSATGGGISNYGSFATVPSLAFDPEGRPIVAWSGDIEGNPDIYLKRLEGSSWVGIGGSASGGGISDTAGDSGHVSLAIGAGGEPVVAWREVFSDDNAEIFIKRWNGSAWVGMNGATAGDNISETPGQSDTPVLAIDHEGYPVVAWNEYTTNYEIYVKRWNGSAWVGMSGATTGDNVSASADGFSSGPSLAVNSEGNPVVAWYEVSLDSDSDIYVKRWSGSAWELMKVNGAPSDDMSLNSGDSYHPSLAVAASGEIAVAWEDDSGPGDDSDIYMKRWTGLTWVEVGGESASGGGISDNLGLSYWPTMATNPEGSWVVAWQDSSEEREVIYFRMWNGSNWVEMEVGSATTGGVSGSNEGYRALRPSLAVAPDGMMMVAWELYGQTSSEIYARRYQLQTYGDWQPIGESAAGYGINLNDGLAVSPSLAFDAEGVPFVAWQGRWGGSNGDIFLRAWNGTDHWEEIGGSATLGGISNTPGDSAQPTLAIDAGGRPLVAWRESTESDQEIYLRRWSGSTWEGMGGSAAGGGLSNTPGDSANPWLAIDHQGRPVVAWVETSTNAEIYLARWDGAGWAALGGSTSGGGISNSPGDSFRPVVAIDGAGNPVVAWADVNINSGNSEIYIRRWSGSSWVEMGGGSASGGGVSATPGGSFRPSLAINAAGAAAVAWEDNSEDEYFDIYVKGYDPATKSWEPVGSGSAGGGGISNNAGPSLWPSLTIGEDGHPAVAWQDENTGRPQVYFRRFDGTAWSEAGPKSAQAGGVSGATSGVQAQQPSLAASGGRWVVVWSHVLGDEEARIYGRAYEPCFPLALSHSGQGQDPVADPANSPGCAPGEYKAGVLVSLTAEPATGWYVADWSGTDNNGSDETTNWLTMPARAHAAAVRYISDEYPLYLPVVVRGQ